MTLELQSEIHDKISEYLKGRISLSDVGTWLWVLLDDLEDESDDEVRRVAGTIGSIISEYSYGDRSEDSMNQELAAAILPFGAKLSIPI